ncbi:MAG: DUF1365 domain-containing protein [Paracoccaceae bacterium]
MTTHVEHIAGHTYHARKGVVQNAFRYSVDYVLLDAETPKLRAPWLFSRNRANLTSVQDRDHGGAPGKGRGAAWARAVLQAYQVHAPGRLLLLAQPRLLGHVFNPVSFWLAHDARDQLIAVIAEVSNTFGDRHSYLTVKQDRTPITGKDRLIAQKIFHVSPFQPIAGGYEFQYAITPDHIGIRIDYGHDTGGLIATLTGPRSPLSTMSLLGAMVRRPLGARRVLALIHWQALKLWWRGARYRPRPKPPERDISP